MTSRYDEELQQLAVTYKTGLAADVSRVMGAITGASESSIIGVGFGGSFTIASLLCNLHESYTGRISRAATSLELICNPTLAASSPVFLISAEGKNPDIIEALRRARGQSSRTVHVLTNRADSPLIDCARELTNVNTLVFDLTEKDGYLATNSLCLLFIHPCAPNLISLRLPGPCRHDFVVCSCSRLCLQGSSRASSRESRSSAAARRAPPFGETAAALECRPRVLGAVVGASASCPKIQTNSRPARRAVS